MTYWKVFEAYTFLPVEGFLANHSYMQTMFKYSAYLWMAIWIGWILRGFMYKMLRSVPNLPKCYGANSWAIVTGGARGVGKGFCQ